MALTADVVFIGGGVTGTSIAFYQGGVVPRTALPSTGPLSCLCSARGPSGQNSSRYRRTQRSASVPFLTLMRSVPPEPGNGVVRHKDGVLASCSRNSSVPQICPGCTWGSTRAAQRSASPPAITTVPSLACWCVCTSPSAARSAGEAGPGPIHLVDHVAGDLRERDRIVVGDPHRVSRARLRGHRTVRAFPHHLQGLTNGRVDTGAHEPAEAVHVTGEGTEHPGRHLSLAAQCLAPWAVVADDVDPIDALQIRRIQPTDDAREHRVHEVVRRLREHTIGLERILAGPQESLHPFPTDPVVVEVAEQTGMLISSPSSRARSSSPARRPVQRDRAPHRALDRPADRERFPDEAQTSTRAR
jgi:hypothetical protein